MKLGHELCFAQWTKTIPVPKWIKELARKDVGGLSLHYEQWKVTSMVSGLVSAAEGETEAADFA